MTDKEQINAVQPLLDKISAHGPWCGRCGKPITPTTSELFLCDGCATESGIRKPVCSTCNGRKWVYALSTEDVQVDCPTCIKTTTAAQERPLTALGELAEYCEREAASHDAAFTQVNAGPQWQNYHMTQRDKFQLWAKAAREANE